MSKFWLVKNGGGNFRRQAGQNTTGSRVKGCGPVRKGEIGEEKRRGKEIKKRTHSHGRPQRLRRNGQRWWRTAERIARRRAANLNSERTVDWNTHERQVAADFATQGKRVEQPAATTTPARKTVGVWKPILEASTPAKKTRRRWWRRDFCTRFQIRPNI